MSLYYDILSEPVGATYERLLAFAIFRSDSFGLVVGAVSGCSPTEQYQEILRKLEPYLLETRETDSWPGTQVFGFAVQLLRYVSVPEVLPTLLSVNGLYRWQSPDAPDDLHFYTGAGECWLANTAHESLAWVDAAFCSLEILAEAVPGIVLATRARQSGT